MARSADPDFEVATIKPADPDDRNQGFSLKGHRISIENNTMTSLICFAYSIHKSQVVNAPQTCHIQSFTIDKLVCSRAIGGSRTYLPQQIVALILPGDGALKLRLVLGFNGGLAAAILGTVVLVATCPVCAVAAGIAALFFFGAAGAVLIGDDQPNHLLYLAPGQQLSGKLGFVQS